VLGMRCRCGENCGNSPKYFLLHRHLRETLLTSRSLNLLACETDPAAGGPGRQLDLDPAGRR